MSPGALARSLVREEVRSLVREEVRDALAGMRRAPAPGPMPRQTGVYRGDTRAKKAVRLRVWELVRDSLGSRDFLRGPHLFLCSREGGDASVLRGMGVGDGSMVAVDCDPRAASDFAQAYPGVPLRTEDVADVLAERGTLLSSAYLDFTSQVSEATLQRVLMAACAVRVGGVVACAFATGREKGGRWAASGGGAVSERLRAVESYVSERVGYAPQVLARIGYSSESVKGPGSNMCVLVMRMAEGSARPPVVRVRAYDLYRDVQRLAGDPALSLLLNCTEEETSALVDRVIQYPPT